MHQLAEQARRLVQAQRTGMLATLSRKHPGWPFGSLLPYAPDEQGQPVFLISSLAVHSHNLAADARASLLVAAPGDNPLDSPRATLLGEVAELAGGEREQARRLYLARHPASEQWADFGDFRFVRLAVTAVYFVAGFGAMGWIGRGDYLGARAG